MEFQSNYWRSQRRADKPEEAVWLPCQCNLEKLEAGGKTKRMAPM